jgi:hypothetical protein
VTAGRHHRAAGRLQQECRQVYVDPSLVQYAVKLVSATRTPDRHGLKDMRKFITFGASPRATINLVEGARALAMLRGRGYALPEDMTDLVPDVLRHRVVLSYEALSEGLTSDSVVQKIMAKVPPRASRWNMKNWLRKKAPRPNRRRPRPAARRPTTPSTCCAGWSGR